MKIALIHNEKKLGTGAHYINDLIATKLRQHGVQVKNFYPRVELLDSSANLRGIASILFFYSLLERRNEIGGFSIIQGTTYTPLPFLAMNIPVITHFGSTTAGFLKATPLAAKMQRDTRGVWYELKRNKVIAELNIKTRQPLRDIAEIERYAALRATAIIAVSEQVRGELAAMGVAPHAIHVIHNAIEDYWYDNAPTRFDATPHIVFLGRLGNDVFTLKLKGFDRLADIYQRFSETPKLTICMTNNKVVKQWLKTGTQKNAMFTNLRKDYIPNVLRGRAGSVLFIPSRYEGFSLSLVEGMSQGLVPVTYAVGIAPEIIEHGRNGYVVKNQSEAVRCIRALLRDDALRHRLALGAFQTAQQFRSDTLAVRLRELYKEVMKESHAKRRADGGAARRQ